MGSYESHREERWLKKKPSSEMEKASTKFIQDITQLLKHLDRLPGRNVSRKSKANVRIEVPPTERGYVIPEFRERLEEPIADDKLNMHEPVDVPVLVRQQNREKAYHAGSISFNYVRGFLEHKHRNLDDAIVHLSRCHTLALEAKSLEYIVKSLIQLAAVYLERYQLRNTEADYRMALRYSDNLMEIGMKEKRDDK